MTTSSEQAAPVSAPAAIRAHFEPVAGWPILPDGVTFNGDATSVAIDSRGRLFVFNRGPSPILVFDRDGAVVDAWGAGEFTRPHAITIDVEDNLYLSDNKGHFVQKRTPTGEVLFTLGVPNTPAPRQSGQCFHEPTDVAIGSTGDLYITDGYGNSKIHRFDRNGEYLGSWGESGSRPGQFSLPHGIVRAADDLLVMCDRENFRVQVFDETGRFVRQWPAHHPLAVRYEPRDELLYVAEMGPHFIQEGVANLGNRVTVFTMDGDIVEQFGSPTPGQGPDQFICPHGIAVDSDRSVYVAEVSASYLASPSSGNRTEEVGDGVELPSLRKWRYVADVDKAR